MAGPHAMKSSDSSITVNPGISEENIEESLQLDERQMSHEIQDLARRVSTHHTKNSPANLFPVPQGSALDPSSDSFSARKWAHAYYTARSAAANGRVRTSGVAFNNLDVYGYGTGADYQGTVANIFLGITKLFRKTQQRIDILRGLEGVVESGELLCVLGPPGSGCSTTLKTIAGDTYGFNVSEDATLNFQGIRSEDMKTAYKGDAVYTAEVDNHFAHLTVNDTLYFAARARCPKTIPNGVSRREYAEHLRDVIMAMFGISHTKNTRVGNDFVRGVSGGERKRVTIAEAALGYAPLQCWDNSTRGLDSANAIEFCKTLRTQADVLGCTACVAIYQAPQAAYDLFDKVLVLYEGRQIFFGRANEAKAYFEQLGFVCPDQQTTPDFLTSMTSESERIIRDGFHDKTPRTPDEFAQAWKNSSVRRQLQDDIATYQERHPFDGHHHEKFFESRRNDQSSMQRSKSPFNLSLLEQFTLNLWRSWVMLKGDPSFTIAMLVMNYIECLIIASIFYDLPEDTSSFFRRTVLLFFVVLMNAFGSILEIFTLYEKRKIIEKQARYAFYHPSLEALASMIIDLPYKLVNAILVNVTIYFMCNLRREAGAFFTFFLFSFVMMISISMMFRFLASATKSIDQALAPSCIILLFLVLYSGFAIPVAYMQDWLGWIRWINPVFYGLESVFLNEFVGRRFPCSEVVPAGPEYSSVNPQEAACSVAGAVPGESAVDGLAFMNESFGFQSAHKWRNLGVIIAYLFLFFILHMLTSEFVSASRSKGEVLVFTREAMKKQRKYNTAVSDVEKGSAEGGIQRRSVGDGSDGVVEEMEKQTSIFHWKDVCYDIKIKSEDRRILDHVDGWVKPGTLTALMGVSGAGKTTLLDVLASRVTTGVVTGDMNIDGHSRDLSFQRKTGYAQQQDIHLPTSTVREALAFSALLRQPRRYSKKEKLAYVDTVINLLDMEEYSDAVVGFPGEGLNVEQRKRLTIGVELAARPQLLLFLDEPTSGLDSQTSWSICNLMEKLTRNGQAILCTVHQPSAVLFQRFDRLLLLAKGGRTVYFGEIGKNSTILMDYFTRNGGPPLPEGANPAEHMLEVIGAAPGAHTKIDWPVIWRDSPEYQGVQDELQRLNENPVTRTATGQRDDVSMQAEFAAPMSVQMVEFTKRLYQQFWRTPSYLYSKFVLSVGAALSIGLSVMNSDNTIRGLQNQMFGVFLFMAIFSQVANQIFSIFCTQRTQYEARERPSKSYSWLPFIVGNIIVELSWNSVMAIFSFIVWYFPVGLYRNAEYTDQVHERGMTTFLFVWLFYLNLSTFAHMLIAGLPTAEAAGGVLNLIFIMMFAFCGVLAGPDELPGFWIFMYRVNPLTYIVDGFLGVTLANAPVECADNELISFSAPGGSDCSEYLASYIEVAGGYLANDSGSGSGCEYCPIASTNDFLASININFDRRWRNFGFLWVYVVFNIAAAIFFYWLARVPKQRKDKEKKKE